MSQISTLKFLQYVKFLRKHSYNNCNFYYLIIKKIVFSYLSPIKKIMAVQTLSYYNYATNAVKSHGFYKWKNVKNYQI